MESQAVELVVQLYQALSEGEKAEVARVVTTERAVRVMAVGMYATTGSASAPIKVRPGGGPAVSAEYLGGWSAVSYCRKVEGVDPTKSGAFAVVGDFLKARDWVQEGDLVFCGFKRPHVGYALLQVRKGCSARLVAFEGGGEREVQDAELLHYGDRVEGVLEKLKEFYL